MPKIEAATVKEHREIVIERLIISAEKLLQENPQAPLTAQSVAKGAGVARNSIYRYVDSVNDLVGIVLSKHLPPWLDAVEAQISSAQNPAERICLWVKANIEQGKHSSHTWIMSVANGPSLAGHAVQVVKSLHDTLRFSLVEEWKKIGSPVPQVHAALTRAILESGFRMIDATHKQNQRVFTPQCPLEAHDASDYQLSIANDDLVVEVSLRAVQAIIQDLTKYKGIQDSHLDPRHVTLSGEKQKDKFYPERNSSLESMGNSASTDAQVCPFHHL